MYLIGEREAELEVVVDTLIAQQGGKDEALLYVIKEIYTTNKVGNRVFFFFLLFCIRSLYLNGLAVQFRVHSSMIYCAGGLFQ